MAQPLGWDFGAAGPTGMAVLVGATTVTLLTVALSGSEGLVVPQAIRTTSRGMDRSLVTENQVPHGL